VARFFDNSEEFIEANGGNPHDFWGVYKIENEPWVFGSDRNGGLYVFKLTGKGRLNQTPAAVPRRGHDHQGVARHVCTKSWACRAPVSGRFGSGLCSAAAR
jgi:hypothetical protein